jgi:hypothetical protein
VDIPTYAVGMTGYVATGRITQAHPRFVGSGPGSSAGSGPGSGRTAADVIPAPSFADPDPDGATVGRSRPLDQRLVERWAQLRDAWAQCTFFLFDPNSWR